MSWRASVQRLDEDAPGLHQLVAHLRAAVRLDEHDQAARLPRGWLVLHELLVLVAPVPACLVAVEERDRVVRVDLDAVLAPVLGAKRHVRQTVAVGVGHVVERLEHGAALATVVVGKPHALRACR